MKRFMLLAAILLVSVAFFGVASAHAFNPMDMVAAGIPLLAMIFNDGAAIEDLRDQAVELRDSMNAIQARADAEKRPLTADEEKEIEKIFAEFESVEANIERRTRIAEVNAKLEAPKGRQSKPEDLQNSASNDDGAPRQRRTPRVEIASSAEIRGNWGFRSQGEFFAAVLASSGKGASIDPRLIANAPTTYGQEGVGADGGFAVPPDFRTAIIQKVMGEESLLSRTDQQTSSSNSITFPADETTDWQESGGIQAYWENEAGQKQQSKPALTEKTVRLNKLIALVPMTDELLEDASAMAGYVGKKAPSKMNFKVNNAILNGTGVGQPLGILNSAGTVEVAAESGQAADTVLAENIVNMWARLTPSAKRNATWIMNSDLDTQLPFLKFPGSTTQPVPLFMPPSGLASAPFGTLMGRPIIQSEAVPALGDRGDIIVGDLSAYLSAVKTGGVKSDVSIHVWFDYDITAFRFVLRVGGQPWWNSAIASLNGNSKGFFVTLGARA
jgi:HK97 family phage major capsid protein